MVYIDIVKTLIKILLHLLLFVLFISHSVLCPPNRDITCDEPKGLVEVPKIVQKGKKRMPG